MSLMSSPLVTVYILNYNYGNYLENCVESVLAQSYKNIEFIIVDDGSTDDSIEVLERISLSHPQITVYRQENIGLVRSIRKIFALAKGEFVVRVDADDWVEETFVERLVSEVGSDQEIALVFPDYFEVDIEGRILHRVKRHCFKSDVTLLDQPAHGACTLTRKSAYASVGGHNESIQCQDGVDIWLALTEKYKVTNCPYPLFYYRKHGANLTTNHYKLLTSRSKIYKDHAQRRGYKSGKALAFIALRSDVSHGDEFCLRKVAGKRLIDWIVDKAMSADEIKEVVVSADSPIIKNYINKFWLTRTDKQKKVVYHDRPNGLSSRGVSIQEVVRNYYIENSNCDYDYLVALTPNYPFSSSMYIDTAIYSAFIHKTDIVDSVVEDDSIFYYHSGNGLKQMSGGDIRHERQNIYIRKGGITVYSRSYINHLLSSCPTHNSIMGHVIVDKYSAFEVQDLTDIQIANFIGNNILEEKR